MNAFIESLELGPRAARAAQRLGVTDIESFLALKRSQVMSVRAAGLKTWHEVYETQMRFEHGPAHLQAMKLEAAVDELNALLQRFPHFQVVRLSNGLLRLSKRIET